MTYQDPEQPQYSTAEQLGYAKVGNRRGLALRVVEYDGMGDEDVADEWLFGDAPREMRLTAIDHVPSLIQALVKATKKLAGTVSEKATVALELAGEVEKIGKAWQPMMPTLKAAFLGTISFPIRPSEVSCS